MSPEDVVVDLLERAFPTAEVTYEYAAQSDAYTFTFRMITPYGKPRVLMIRQREFAESVARFPGVLAAEIGRQVGEELEKERARVEENEMAYLTINASNAFLQGNGTWTVPAGSLNFSTNTNSLSVYDGSGWYDTDRAWAARQAEEARKTRERLAQEEAEAIASIQTAIEKRAKK